MLDGVYPAIGPKGFIPPIDVPEVIEPVYYRQGETLNVKKPDDRAEKPNGSTRRSPTPRTCFRSGHPSS